MSGVIFIPLISRFTLILFIIACTGQIAMAQNGYVKLKNSDSTIVGYIKRYVPVGNGPQGIEVWKTKTDKNPRRIPKTEIYEFAIKKDTFRILHQFQPFPSASTFFEYLEAKVVSRGKVTLLSVENYADPGSVSTFTGGGLVPVAIDAATGNLEFQKIMGSRSQMYVLENAAGYNAVSPRKNDLKETLLDYFPDKFVEKYAEKFGEITYRSLDEMVTFYNSK
jgi:hypothetical protein